MMSDVTAMTVFSFYGCWGVREVGSWDCIMVKRNWALSQLQITRVITAAHCASVIQNVSPLYSSEVTTLRYIMTPNINKIRTVVA
jgi:hypothetical protein